MIDKSFSLRIMIILCITTFVIISVIISGDSPLASLYKSLHNVTFYPLRRSLGCIAASPSATVSSLPRNTRDFLFCWRVELWALYLEQCANQWHWQSMSRIVGCDLSGQLTHRYQSDSYRQMFKTTWHQITASFFLENSSSFMSVAIEGCNFEATSLHFLLWLLALRR